MLRVKNIIPPLGYKPRWYQLQALDALDSGTNYAYLCWNRRAGKDFTAFTHIMRSAFRKPGHYIYFWPVKDDGIKVVLRGRDKNSEAYIDRIPRDCVRNVDLNEGVLTFSNGSFLQIVGTDYRDFVGHGAMGMVFSELAQQRDTVLSYQMPVLRENNGWAIITTTPRGKNHAHRVWKAAVASDEWFASHKTVFETQSYLDGALAELMNGTTSKEQWLQEYMCDWDAGFKGSVWGSQIAQSQIMGNIGCIPQIDGYSVHTSWDIGWDDAMAFWVFQYLGIDTEGNPLINFLHYYENSRRSFVEHYRPQMQALCPECVKGIAIVPHDAAKHDPAYGHTFADAVHNSGIEVRRVERVNKVSTGVDIVRDNFAGLKFDEEKCAKGIAAIKAYRWKYDSKRQITSNEPEHDWSSHAASALIQAVRAAKMGLLRTGNEYVPESEDNHDPTWGGRIKPEPQPERAYMRYAQKRGIGVRNARASGKHPRRQRYR